MLNSRVVWARKQSSSPEAKEGKTMCVHGHDESVCLERPALLQRWPQVAEELVLRKRKEEETVLALALE